MLVKAYCLVGVSGLEGVEILIGVHSHRRDPHRAGCACDSNRNFTAVGDQQLANQCRNTPHSIVPSTGALCAAERAIASTLLVSRGSITPSSHNRAVAK